MISAWDQYQDAYASRLAEAAQRENRAVFGRRKSPAVRRQEIWSRVFEAMDDTPRTAIAIAELVNMPVDTVRRHLAGLHSVGAVTRMPTETAPRGGYVPAEWVKAKETK